MTNNGANWTALTPIPNILYVSSIAAIGTHLFASIYGGGVFLSTDIGTTWTAMNNSPLNTNVLALAVSGTNLFAGTINGVYISTDYGTSWTKVVDGMTNTFIQTLAVSGTNLYAGTRGGVFLSTNNGTTWTAINNGLTNLSISSIAIYDTNLFVGGANLGGVFLSTDNGANWTNVSDGLLSTGIFTLAIYENNLFAGTNGASMWRRPLSEMLPATLPSGPSNLQAIADTFSVDLSWDDNSDNELGFKIERKDDSLSVPGTWTLIDSVGANETAFTDTGLTPNTVYSYKVYAYNEAGNSISDSVQTVTVIPVELISFTASVSGNKVSLNWSTATEINNRGFDVERQSANQPINQSFQWEKVGYAAGFGTTAEPKSYTFMDDKVTTGKYSYRLKQIDFNGTYTYSNEIEVNVELPLQFSLSQNYPNPFNPATLIKYSIPDDGFVRLGVYNILGQEVEELVNGNLRAGNHEIIFNAQGLASGFITIDSNQTIMLLLKNFYYSNKDKRLDEFIDVILKNTRLI